MNGWNCGFAERAGEFANKKHDCSVMQLVLEFFKYFAKLDCQRFVVCPLLAKLVKREDMTRKNRAVLLPGLEDYMLVNEALNTTKPLVVQDPFDLLHNVTKGFSEKALERSVAFVAENVG